MVAYSALHVKSCLESTQRAWPQHGGRVCWPVEGAHSGVRMARDYIQFVGRIEVTQSEVHNSYGVTSAGQPSQDRKSDRTVPHR